MDPQHPSQLPDDWKERLSKAYDVFAIPTLEERQREIKRVLRNRDTGMYMRRRNTPESMRTAPSPFKSRVFYPAPLSNLIRVDGKGFPPDVYDRLQDYMDQRPTASRWNRETTETINQAQGRPDMAVTVFRPVPWIINQFVPGDSVLLSPSYAGTLAAGRPKWRVITGTVPARELFTRSDDQLMRWNWHGREPLPNGGVSLPRPAPRGHR
jgi:hypothetical protein